MKNFLRVLLIVLVVLILAAGALLWWQWDNIRAIRTAATLAPEDIQAQLESNEQELEKIISQYLPPEQIPNKSGTSPEPVKTDTPPGTENQAEAPAAEQQTPAPDAAQSEPQPETGAEPQVVIDLSGYDPDIAAVLQEFYALRDDLMSKLDDIKTRAYKEYHSYSEEERAALDFAKMAAKYVKEVTILEMQCDKKVDKLISRLRSAVKKANGDQELPQAVYSAYLKEKELKKAWYMSELEKRGLVLS